MRLTVRQKIGNRQVARLTSELPKRVAALIRNYPLWIANKYLEELQARGPDDIPGYLGDLEVQEFDHPLADHVFGVVLPGYERSTRLRIDDVARTVLMVEQRNTYRPDPGVAVLERYNPWTMDTLPYEPGKVANLVSRKVTEREVNVIRERRQADRKAVDAELRSLDIKVNRAHPTLLQSKVERDVVFEVLRREYGAPGEKHQPHLRVGLSSLQRNIEPRLWRRLAVRYLSIPAERRWQRRERAKRGDPRFPKRVRPLQDLILGVDEADL